MLKEEANKLLQENDKNKDIGKQSQEADFQQNKHSQVTNSPRISNSEEEDQENYSQIQNGVS